jgi:hypothetical protein
VPIPLLSAMTNSGCRDCGDGDGDGEQGRRESYVLVVPWRGTGERRAVRLRIIEGVICTDLYIVDSRGNTNTFAILQHRCYK